jgi:protein-tyrosine kinase
MRSLLEELKRQVPERAIIIDSPPVLPFAETQALSSLVDSVLYVVREGATTVQELQDALEIIEGAKILGIVFNGVTDRTMNNRYYHYYRYYAEQRHQQA